MRKKKKVNSLDKRNCAKDNREKKISIMVNIVAIAMQ